MAAYMTPAGLARLAELGVTQDDLKEWQRTVGTGDDGDPGPKTFAATIAFLRARGLMVPAVAPDATRARVVTRARSFLGADGSARAQDPNQFFRLVAPMYADRGYEKSKAWCGIFALSCYVLEGLWPADAPLWIDGSGFAMRAVKDGRLKPTHDPQAGDLVIFGAPLWHHAIVERVAGGKVYSIDGNVLGNIEGCSAKVHTIDAGTAFYSIAPLLARA